MRALIFDPFSGISGDMVLGALLDLGLPAEWLRSFIGGLRLAPIEVETERVERQAIACTRLILRLPHEHAHRHLKDVVEIIEGAGVEGIVRDRAIDAFTALAVAEAEVHGTTPERVHFHEVGALDAVVDILGTMAAVQELGFERFYTRPVTLGRGWAEMEHGRFPVPPPAVLKLLEGIPTRDPPMEGECTTPTGAAILRVLTKGVEPPTTFVPRATGFGAGTRDPRDRPNCLRLMVVDAEDAPAEELLVLQTDLDDMQPEYVPPLVDAVLEAGARDCVVIPISMKKGRAGLRIEALVRPAELEPVRAALFHGSSSLGIRWWSTHREALPRSIEEVQWRGHIIRVKRSLLPGTGERAKPEFEDVARAARALGITPLAAYRAMLADGIAVEQEHDSSSPP